jgi:1-deoxy-D-xylulose-5-phosphate synthase
VKPIDEEAVREACRDHRLIVTMEENVLSGGFGEKVREYVDCLDVQTKVLTITIPDEYVEHGNVELLKLEIGIDADSIVKKVVTRYTSILGAG